MTMFWGSTYEYDSTYRKGVQDEDPRLGSQATKRWAINAYQTTVRRHNDTPSFGGLIDTLNGRLDLN